MDNDRSIFDAMCVYAQNYLDKIMSPNETEHKISMARFEKTAQELFGIQTDKNTFDKMWSDFSDQIKTARSNTVQKTAKKSTKLYDVPEEVCLASREALAQHSKWPHFGTTAAIETALRLSSLPYVSEDVIKMVARYAPSLDIKVAENTEQYWSMQLWGGFNAKSWAKSLLSGNNVKTASNKNNKVSTACGCGCGCDKTKVVEDVYDNSLEEALEQMLFEASSFNDKPKSFSDVMKSDGLNRKERNRQSFLKNSGFKD